MVLTLSCGDPHGEANPVALLFLDAKEDLILPVFRQGSNPQLSSRRDPGPVTENDNSDTGTVCQSGETVGIESATKLPENLKYFKKIINHPH